MPRPQVIKLILRASRGFLYFWQKV